MALTRRELLAAAGRAGAAAVVASPYVQLAYANDGTVSAQAAPSDLNIVAGLDRVVMDHGKTYLNGWAGYGEPPRRDAGVEAANGPAAAAQPPGPAPGDVEQGVGSRHGDVRRPDGGGHDGDVLDAWALCPAGHRRQRHGQGRPPRSRSRWSRRRRRRS